VILALIEGLGIMVNRMMSAAAPQVQDMPVDPLSQPQQRASRSFFFPS